MAEKLFSAPNLSFRKASSATKAAANVTEADIRAHCVRIEEGLKKEGCDHLLLQPERVLNADVSFFVLNPVSGEVCFQKGTKHAQRVVVDEKAGITAMLTVRADGKKPFFVYPQFRISAAIDSAFPHERASRTGTESGWMNGEAFCEYLRNIAEELRNDINLAKVLLFVTRELDIFMVSFYPNKTPLTQPTSHSWVSVLGVNLKMRF